MNLYVDCDVEAEGVEYSAFPGSLWASSCRALTLIQFVCPAFVDVCGAANHKQQVGVYTELLGRGGVRTVVHSCLHYKDAIEDHGKRMEDLGLFALVCNQNIAPRRRIG